MVFGSGRKYNYDLRHVTFNGVDLQKINQFTRLGHILTPNPKNNSDIERERRVLSVRVNMI